MRRLAQLLLITGCVLLPACSHRIFHSSDGLSVSERNGQLFVDDVLVQHHREVELSLNSAQLGVLKLSVPTGLVDIVGVPGGEALLIIDVYSEFEDDGDIYLAGGKLKVRSSRSGKIVINGVRGRIPVGTSIEVDTGTGQVLISGLRGSDSIDIDTGTGAVRLLDNEVNTIKINSGTGDIRLENTHAQLLDVDTGTGNLVSQGCRLDEVRADSGTGDFIFKQSQVEQGRFETGTGDLRLIDTVIAKLRTSMGTGDVYSDSVSH
jgi:hypothetical protein